MFEFLEEDYRALHEKKRSLLEKRVNAGRDIGDANQQSSESWHDNAPMDVAQREFERLNTLLRDLEQVIRNSKIVRANELDPSIIGIGSEVTFVDQDAKEQTVKIGSYLPRPNSDSISYEAPVASLLVGYHAGDIVEGTVANRHVEYRILKVARWI